MGGCALAQAGPQAVVVEHADERGGQVGRRASQPGHPRHHGVAMAPDVGDHRRRAAGGGLGDRHAPALGHRRAGQDPRRPVEGDELVVGDVAREVRPRRGVERLDPVLEVLTLGALAHDHELGVGHLLAHLDHRVEQGVEALDRHQPADGDDERHRRSPATGREARVDTRGARR